jgi:hypothetical protein
MLCASNLVKTYLSRERIASLHRRERNGAAGFSGTASSTICRPDDDRVNISIAFVGRRKKVSRGGIRRSYAHASFGYLVSLSSDASVLGVLSSVAADDDDDPDDPNDPNDDNDDDPICYIRAFQLHTNDSLQRQEWIQMGRDLKADQDKDDLF